MRSMVLLGCLAAGVTLGACTVAASTAPTTTPRHDDVALCSPGTQVRSLVVTRHAGYQEHLGFRAVVRSGSRTAARVVDAVCALPPAPTAMRWCTASLGPLYRLVVRTDDAGVAVVEVDPSGCATVTSPTHSIGAGDLGARSPSARLWRVLGTAVGVRDATWRTFVGTPSWMAR